MNSNFPKSLPKVNNTSTLSSMSNIHNKTISYQAPHSLNRVSILKTEEQKKVVRTNVYDPNGSKPGKNQKFTVVTEVINRSSNISFAPQRNSFSNGPMNFSFNQMLAEEPMNQSFQNKIININIADSSSKLLTNENKKIKDSNSGEYKMLIKRIASQLKRKVREPTQGYFYFAFQKGNYPLIIIRKIQNQIINHSIDFKNNIFRIYTQKYIQYRELIKKIAFLLKKSMKKGKISAQNNQIEIQKEKKEITQIKVSKNTLNNKINIKANVVDTSKNNANNNAHGKSPYNRIKNNDMKKNNSKDNLANKKNVNINTKNFRTNSNDTHSNIQNVNITNYSNTNNYQQKKAKPQINQFNSFKNTNSNLRTNTNMNNIGSYKSINYIGSFAPNKERKKMNLTKKNEISSNMTSKNPFVSKPHINNKEKMSQNKNNNSVNNKIETNSVISAPINKNESIINININKTSNITNEIQMPTLDNEMKQISNDINNDNKMDIINEEVKTVQNTGSLNISFLSNNLNKNMKFDLVSTQSEPIINNNESNIKLARINSDIIPNKNEVIEYKNDINKLSVQNTLFNNDKEFIGNNISKNNNITPDVNSNENTNKIITMNSIQKDDNKIMSSNNNMNSNSNPLFIKENKGQRISLNSRKDPNKKIEIKLSAFKKGENVINSNTKKDTIEKLPSVTKNNIVSNINQQNNNDMQQRKKNIIIDNFNAVLNNNNIVIESNLPITKDENGKKVLKQNKFWEDYIHYLYELYQINNNKMSLFYFIQIIEQYFIWCENTTTENNLNFKKLIIDTVNKIYNEEEISLFLTMNKIDNLENLFKKYEIYMKKNNSNNFVCGREIEIKFDNYVECNCELCKDEIACMNKMVEINKNLITNVVTDNIFYSGKGEEKEECNPITTIDNTKQNPMFSNSKTKYSFEYQYRYIPKVKYQIIELKKYDDTKIIKFDEEKEENSEKYIDLTLNNKIDDYFKKEEIKKEKESEEKDIKKEKEDSKKEKKQKSKSKSKERKSKKIKEEKTEDENNSESDNEKEIITKNKKNKKKAKKKKKYIEKFHEIDSEDDGNNSSGKKKNYPKNRKNKGKK